MMRLARRASLLLVFSLLTSVGCAHDYGRAQEKGHDWSLVADPYYWTWSEGNLGIQIWGNFQSEMQLIRTLDLSRGIGLFKSKSYPFQPTSWKLRDILLSVDFNGSGYVAIWRVSGPKPLLMKYLENLRRGSEDKSVFYTLSYKFIDLRPSSD